jgi:hypothetical protein
MHGIVLDAVHYRARADRGRSAGEGGSRHVDLLD